MVLEFKGDSFVVDIIPPAKTAPYPMIYVCPRKKSREKGKLALDSAREKFLKVSPGSFDTLNIDETARQIGKAILDDSEIIRNWRASRPLSLIFRRGAGVV